VKGTGACQETGGWVQVSGTARRGTRVIWRKQDCLNPNLQKRQVHLRRNDTRHRRQLCDGLEEMADAPFGGWSDAQ
jgi:hypothetical protein